MVSIGLYTRGHAFGYTEIESHARWSVKDYILEYQEKVRISRQSYLKTKSPDVHEKIPRYINTYIHRCINTYVHIHINTYMNMYINTCVHTCGVHLKESMLCMRRRVEAQFNFPCQVIMRLWNSVV